ncbi:hypothetical protein BKA69DRAFT_1179408 [Paraphysoderma sedebokerense]|nr:hypothetical protein BKA69DRAFT_1179408 [Paraphysoderma sedebokerense]
MEQIKALVRKTKVLPITQNFMDQLRYLGLAPILPLVNADCFVSSADGKRVLANPLSVGFMRTEQFQIVKIETFDKAFRRRLRNAGLETGNINFLETIFENITQEPSEVTALDERYDLDMYSIVIEGRGDGKRTELPVLEFKVKSLDTAAALLASTVQIDDSVYKNLKEKAFNLPLQSLEEGIVFLLETCDVFKILISKDGQIIAATTAGKSNIRFFSSPFTFAIPMRGACDLFDVPKDVRRVITLDKRIVSAFASKTRRKDESIAWCIGTPSKPYLDAVKASMKRCSEVDIATGSKYWVRLDYFDRFYEFVQQKTVEVETKKAKKDNP